MEYSSVECIVQWQWTPYNIEQNLNQLNHWYRSMPRLFYMCEKHVEEHIILFGGLRYYY